MNPPIQRPLTAQLFSQSQISVQTTPNQILPTSSINSLIDSFIISVPAAAANSVFVGGPNVTIDTGGNCGLEITAGNLLNFRIDQVRQLYELQNGVDTLVKKGLCPPDYLAEAIPFVVWDLTTLYIVASAVTTVGLMVFRNPYI